MRGTCGDSSYGRLFDGRFDGFGRALAGSGSGGGSSRGLGGGDGDFRTDFGVGHALGKRCFEVELGLRLNQTSE